MSDFSVETAVTAKDDGATRTVDRVADRLKGRLVGAANVARSALVGVASAARSALVGATKYATVGAGALAGVTVKLAHDFTEAADEAAEFAARVALPIEALQEYRYAAERSGAGADAFNAGIEKFNVQLGKLKAGTGGLAKFLGRVAPALKEQLVLAKDSDEAFMLMAEAVRRLDDPTQQMALATAAWGSAGLKLLLMMKGGAGDIDELRRAAHRFGIISEADAEKAGELDDAMVDLKAATTGLKNAIGVELVPVLTPLVEQLTEWIVANRELVGSKVAEWVERAGNAAATAWEYFSAVDWPAVGEGVSTVGVAIWDVGEALAWAIEKVGGLEVALGLLVGGKLLAGIGGLAARVASVGAAAGGAGAGAGAAGVGATLATGAAVVGSVGLGVAAGAELLKDGPWLSADDQGAPSDWLASLGVEIGQTFKSLIPIREMQRDKAAQLDTPALVEAFREAIALNAHESSGYWDELMRRGAGWQDLAGYKRAVSGATLANRVFDPEAYARAQTAVVRFEMDLKNVPKGVTTTVVESSPAVDTSLRVGRRP